MGELSGQVALITGGGRGIGRAVAQAFAAAGAQVAATARSADQLAETVALITAAGGKALALPADVSDPEAVARMVAETERQLGPVDVLVNSAGATGTAGPLWEVDVEEWWHCAAVNIRGPMLCAHRVLPGMVARRRGRILNVVSAAATMAGPYGSAYITTKTALLRFSEVLALETKEYGISVFAVDPGGVRTAMTEAFFGSPAGRRWVPGMAERMEANSPTPERAANLCLRLAEGVADSLSGCYLSVTHDLPALIQQADDLRKQELYTLRLRT